MFHISDEPRDVVSADEQPFLYACDLDGEDPRQGWVPMDDDFVMFMSDGRECQVCRHSHDERGRAPQLCLHIRKAGDILAITHACNLHEPGEFIIARRMAVWPKQSLYQLTSSPPPGADLPGFRPAAGIVTLSLGKGKRKLRAVGTVEGWSCTGDCIVAACEIIG